MSAGEVLHFPSVEWLVSVALRSSVYSGIAASAAFVMASPLLVLALYVVVQAATFDGTCGPYAPDIGPHACSMPSYLANLFSPFALFGMCALTPVVMAITSVAVVAMWVGRLIRGAARARRRG